MPAGWKKWEVKFEKMGKLDLLGRGRSCCSQYSRRQNHLRYPRSEIESTRKCFCVCSSVEVRFFEYHYSWFGTTYNYRYWKNEKTVRCTGFIIDKICKYWCIWLCAAWETECSYSRFALKLGIASHVFRRLILVPEFPSQEPQVFEQISMQSLNVCCCLEFIISSLPVFFGFQA